MESPAPPPTEKSHKANVLGGHGVEEQSGRRLAGERH